MNSHPYTYVTGNRTHAEKKKILEHHVPQV